MGTFGRTPGACGRAFHPGTRSGRFAIPAVFALVAVTVALPLAAADCGECDAGCHLQTDAFALMESYAEDEGRFAERSNRCSASDPRWSEILSNIQEMDKPPPRDDSSHRPISRFELAMINHKIGISSCMQFCGREEYREHCVGGPGGMSCDCKPAAGPYCRSQANQSAVDTIAPGYAGGTASSEPASDTGSTEGEPGEAGEPEPEPERVEEARYMIEVSVSAEGFEPSTAYVVCSVEPSSVTVSGTVTDDDARPLGGARVTLIGLGVSALTDGSGAYSLSVRTEGDTPFSAVSDVMIVRLVRDLRATVAPVATVWANGREVEAVLTVTAEGRPLAGKEVTLTDWGGFSRGGRDVDYVAAGRGNHIPLRLDDDGQARFRFQAPVVPRARGATIERPETLFPVDGRFRVKVRGQDADTTCAYRVESPFPRIGRIRVPGNVDAGLWQVSPSSIVIEDPDSDRFRVTVRGLGDFRTTQPGAATKSGVLTYDLTGTRFEFLYRPPAGGFDPTALPDVLDEFMNTSKNIYIGVVTNVVGGMLVDEVKVVFPSGGLDKGLSKLGLQLDAGTLLDAGGNMANVVNMGSTTYLDLTTISEDANDVQKKIVAGGNYVIGAVDTSMGFAGTLGTAQQKLAWEAAKAYWEYIKLMNSLTGQYQDIANAYQGTVLHPIQVVVEDENGHRTTANRACSVRVWQAGSK